MTANPPLFRDEIYERIETAARRKWQTIPQYDRDPIPDREALRQLFENAFFASLRSEEGVSTSFRLTYSDPARLDDRERRWPSVSTVKFAASFDLSVSELVKLAHSHDPRTATFAVIPSGSGLRIAGIFQFGPIRAPLAETGRKVPPIGFCVLAKGPGRLAISVGPWLIGRFEDGDFSEPQPSALATHTELGERLHGAALQHTWHEPDQVDKETYATMYLRCFEELLYGMAARGHGGTVLWAPRPTILENAKRHLKLRREVNVPSHSGVFHLAQYVRTPSGDARHDMLSRLRQYIGMLAQFTVVDGALLIDDWLMAAGFSAEIQAPAWSGTVIDMSTPWRRPVDMAKLGMRHNSAVRFATAVPGSIAMVLSADGPARGIMAGGDGVLWWPDITTSVFA